MMTMRSRWVWSRTEMSLSNCMARGDNGNAAAGVANLLGDLLAGERGIDGHIGGANGERGKVGDQPTPSGSR